MYPIGGKGGANALLLCTLVLSSVCDSTCLCKRCGRCARRPLLFSGFVFVLVPDSGIQKIVVVVLQHGSRRV